MIILYDKNHNKICGLVNYKDLSITREINKLDTLSFLYPISDKNYNSIAEEGYIRTKDNEYVIKEINYSDDNYDQVVCEVNIEGIKGNPISHFETKEQKCTDVVNLALAGTGWTIGSCDVTKLRTVKKSNCSSYDVLQEIENIYKCEMSFDAINKKVYIYQSMGTDKGVYFSEQLNLKKVDTQKNTHDYITRLIPIGKNGLDITNVNNGISYVESHQYSNKIITAYWSDNRYTVAQDLKDDAVERLDYLSKPQKNYSCDVYDLANISDKYSILNYGLGDTITLLSKSRNVKEKQRIVKLVQYPDEPEKNTCEISNKLANIEDLITRFADTSDTVDDVTTSDNMLDGSKIDNFDTDNIQHVHIKMADIDSLSATIADIGTLIATKATITDLTATNAKIDNLTATKANVTDLTASNARIKTLEGESASINTLLTKGLTAANMQAGFITADSGLIANGAIKDAMIDTVSVKKVLAGDISTNKFRIVSDSGNMLMSDNTIQIKDSNRVRVQIGKDVNADYNMYVWDASGNLMFDATGLKGAGIKEKIIRDDMVSDTANINGSKIEKESLVAQINGATTLLKASKVHLDTENQTLDLAFTALKTTATNTANTVSSQGTAISTMQGQISSKVWQQDITTAIDGIQVGGRNLIIRHDEIKGKMVAQDGTIEDFNVSSLMADFISVTPGESLAFSQTIVYSSGDNYFRYAYYGSDKTTLIKRTSNCSTSFIDIVPASAAYLRVSYITVNTVKLERGNKVTDWTPAPEDTDAQITTLNSNYSSLTQTVNGISSNVGSLQTQMSTANGNITSVTNKESSLEQTVNGLSNTVSSVQQNYLTKSDAITTYATQTSVSSLSQTVSGLSSTVSSTKTEIDGLQIGGRNYVQQQDLTKWVKESAISVIATDNGYYKIAKNTATSDSEGCYYDIHVLANTTYTLSFKVRNNMSYTFGIGGNVNCWSQYTGGYGIINANIVNIFTFVTSTSETYVRIYFTSAPHITNGLLEVKNIQLEIGNKATDFQEAPENTQSQIDSATTRISSCESSISQQAGQIAQKVSSTDFDNLQNRVSSAEQKITADAIVSTVRNSASYVNDLNGRVSTSDFGTYKSQTATEISSKVSANDVHSIIQQTPSDIQIGFNGISNLVNINSQGLSINNGLIQSSQVFGNGKKTSKLADGELYLYEYDSNGNLQYNSQIFNNNNGLGIYSNGQMQFIKIDNTYGNIPMGIITPRMGATPSENFQGELEWDGPIQTTCMSKFQSVEIGIDTGGHYCVMAPDQLYLEGNGAVVTYQNANGYAPIRANSFNNASSIEFKENITKFDTGYAYNLLKNNMVACKYKYKGDKRPYSVGVIAEESPMEITDRQDCKSIDIYAYATVIMAALQKAQEKIEVLEQEVNELKGVAA